MDRKYIRRTLELAEKGKHTTHPNPMVGAVIVKDGRIIGEGFHEKFGGNHAEINAFLHATEEVAGATMYVNLEPCSHYGKTPPCVNAIIKNKIGRVVVGMQDPNPLVQGRGVQILREQGIEVTVGVLEEECKKLNTAFLEHMASQEESRKICLQGS